MTLKIEPGTVGANPFAPPTLHTDATLKAYGAAEYTRGQDDSHKKGALVIPGYVSGPMVHETSKDCWCNPEVDYVDPDTGATVYVHKEPQ